MFMDDDDDDSQEVDDGVARTCASDCEEVGKRQAPRLGSLNPKLRVKGEEKGRGKAERGKGQANESKERFELHL